MEDLKEHLKDTKQKIKEYVNLRIQLLKLEISGKLADGLGAFSFIILIGMLGMLFLLFCSFALAYLLGELLDSNAAGFGLTALLFVVLAVILIMLRKKISTYVTDQVLESIGDELDD